MSEIPPTEIYSDPEFDATTLKVAQLRGLLLEYGASFPSSAKKAELVGLFEDHVRPQAQKSRHTRVTPSSKGIVSVAQDGTEIASVASTGTKRSRRRKTEEEPQKIAEPPKKRGRKSTKSVEVEVATRSRRSDPMSTPSRSMEKIVSKKRSDPSILLMDEVEDEEELRKTPRRSMDSGFSDYNPFQSGGEEPKKRKKTRVSEPKRESKRRISEPRVSESKPEQASQSNATEARASEPIPAEPKPRVSPRAKRVSEPQLSEPTITTPHGLRRVAPSRENLKTPPPHITQLRAAEEYNHQIQDKLNQLGPVAIPKPKTSWLPLGALLLLLLSFVANYKSQSAAIGYCDSGESTNDIVLHRQSALDNAQACISRRTAMDLDNPGSGSAIQCDVSALPLVPFLPRPTSCTPCPQHAICNGGKLISCEPEYLLSPNPLTITSPIFDGLVGPRAFPPSCRPDTARKRMVGGLAKSMEGDLARGRGIVVCAGLGKDGRVQGERFGMEENTLRERYAAMRDPKFSREQFEEIFEAALKDLVEHDDVVESIDVNGRSWYAAARTEMTLACAAKLHMIDMLEKWKSQLISTSVVIAMIMYIRKTMQHRQQEKYKAEELVQVVLKRLQDQEHLHYVDPVTTPNPFIPPTQLRDVVMPPKGSTTSRTRLWQRVQDLVEANANVAVREREVKGELWKTWEWQGVGERHVTWM